MKIIITIIIPIIYLLSKVEGITVHKAKIGETTIIPCPSNDKIHRFQYWLLKNDEIIGPWNNDDKNKYRYEAWSGRLIIRSVSDDESGIYKCFSKKILGNELKSETVELLVMREWEDSYENDSRVNIYRIVVAVLVIIILITMGIFGILLKRQRSFVFNELREPSPEEFSPSTNNEVYRATSISLKKSPAISERSVDRGLDNAIVETDISTSFSLPN